MPRQGWIRAVASPILLLPWGQDQQEQPPAGSLAFGPSRKSEAGIKKRDFPLSRGLRPSAGPGAEQGGAHATRAPAPARDALSGRHDAGPSWQRHRACRGRPAPEAPAPDFAPVHESCWEIWKMEQHGERLEAQGSVPWPQVPQIPAPAAGWGHNMKHS